MAFDSASAVTNGFSRRDALALAFPFLDVPGFCYFGVEKPCLEAYI